MELNFVIPGWYKSKHNTGDTVQTIRVLRGGDKGPNHFLLMDGREMHENEILDNWEYMSTSIDEFGPPQENFRIGDIETPNEIQEELPHYEQEEIFEYNREVVTTYSGEQPINVLPEKIYNQPKTVEKNPEEIFVDQLLKKISSEQQSNGEISFDIPIKFTFKYDLNKLKKILNLIDIDSINLDMFVNKIISNDSVDINSKINHSIKEFLLKEETKIIREPVKTEEIKKERIQKIEDKLINTSNYLNNM